MKKKVISLLLLASLTTMAFTGCAVKLPFGIEFTLGGNEKPDQEVSNTQPEIIVDNSETEMDYDYDYGNNGNDVPEDKPEDEPTMCKHLGLRKLQQVLLLIHGRIWSSY